MTSSSTEFSVRYSPITATPAPTRIPARYAGLTSSDAQPSSAHRGFPSVGLAAAWLVAVLVAGAVALAVAARAVGGSTGSVLGWTIVPDLSTAALIAVCSASYGSRPDAKSARAAGRRRSRVQFDKA